MGEYLRQACQRISDACMPFHRFTPFAASALTLVAGVCQSRPPRYFCLTGALVLLFIIVADLARSFLDPDIDQPLSYASDEGPPDKIPVNAGQVLLTGMLALVYASMIFLGLHSVFLSSLFMFLLMTPIALVLSTLAAWRNVRLWYREGADYEQALEEEASLPHNLHIPPGR